MINRRLFPAAVFLCLAISVGLFQAFAALPTEDGSPVGTVVRIQGSAVAMQDALPRTLKAGDKVLLGDVLSTGKNARLEMRMIDDAVITLGERTVFVVVDYVVENVNPNVGMRLLQGAFSAVSGKVVETASSRFTVSTEVATIGIRGTTFWGGMLDGEKFEVALLDGKGVYVETKAGRVELTDVGQGTAITTADQPPSEPKIWGAQKTARAVATVSFSK